MDSDNDLDPRIQIELENLNAATDEINKLEIELEEANSTFRILMNESTRRLKVLSKKLGNCIEKARPYYEALEEAREAQIECQKAAVKFQRANEIHAAAKETVALAEQRFMSNSHEWQFDNAWQESLNCATLKVMDAESKKAECHAEHQRKTQIFNTAERKVQHLEERFRRSIQRSRPYFEAKQICQDQLQTQKGRVMELQSLVQGAKAKYSTALRNLEHISEDIHKKRGDLAMAAPPGPREPGVGAEQLTTQQQEQQLQQQSQLPDINFELEKCDLPSLGSEMSLTASSAVSERDIDESEVDDDENDNDDINNDEVLEELRKKVKSLAVRPVEGGDGQQQEHDVWESELNATVDKLDHLMMIKECEALNTKQQNTTTSPITTTNTTTTTNTSSSSSSSTIVPPPPLSSSSSNLKITNNNKIMMTTLTTTLYQNHHNYHTNKNNNSRYSSSYSNNNNKNTSSNSIVVSSLPATPAKLPTSSSSSSTTTTTPITAKKSSTTIKTLAKIDPLPSANVSMRELPLLARLSNEICNKAGYLKQRRRSLD